ncbi:MAG: tRNA (adenosine(37)-N6)-dimethylallyltransferase MiaA [Alphaproteobacteria bacterium]|nr:tRNA (adenosine(37)-N6)-dimethylallyltransferase MiaA [Alphaproteobacteria bacterium]
MERVAPAVLIAGPTASGKSQLALRLAEALAPFGGGRIINADSMQVYRELRIVTARPSAADEARVPHWLYGSLSVLEVCSAGRWRAMALAEIEAARRDGVVPILVGGTGLYFNALVKGLAPVPPISAEVRAEARARLKELGIDAFRAELVARDARSAESIRPTDTQRLVRAWEVIEATGTPLHEWQRRQPLGEDASLGRHAKVLLLPERERVNAAIDARVPRMVEEGVYAEVAAFDALGPGEDLPATRAVGVPEFRAWVRGVVPEAEAVAAVRQATRRYAKRQYTWFRTQAPDWPVFGAGTAETTRQYLESMVAEVFPFIREFLLTPLAASD